MKRDLKTWFTSYLRYLPKTDDITLIVLRGHLLLEEQLVAILETSVEAPEELPTRLSFNDRLRLVKAICPWEHTDKFGDPYKFIETLNTLRNKLVHHIEPPDLEKLVENVIRPFREMDLVQEGWVGTNVEALRSVISFSAGFLEQRLDEVREKRKG